MTYYLNLLMNFNKRILLKFLLIIICLFTIAYLVIIRVNKSKHTVNDLGYREINSIKGSNNNTFNIKAGVKYKQQDSLLLLNVELETGLNIIPSLRFAFYDKDGFVLFSFITIESFTNNGRFVASYVDKEIKKSLPGVKSELQNGIAKLTLSYFFPLNKGLIENIDSFTIKEYR